MPSPTIPSARVLENRRKRVQMHRDSLDAVVLGMADGLFSMGLGIALDITARAPRDPEAARERGVPMMADTTFVQVWANGKRAAGVWQEKPRGVAVPKDQAVLIVGMRSPLAHLVELGTIKMNARPFMLPAFNRGLPGADKFVVPAIGKRLREVP